MIIVSACPWKHARHAGRKAEQHTNLPDQPAPLGQKSTGLGLDLNNYRDPDLFAFLANPHTHTLIVRSNLRPSSRKRKKLKLSPRKTEGEKK